jgi:pilus assembly protein CpaE
MPIIVEFDRTSAEALQSALGGGTVVVPGLEDLRHELDERPLEYAVVVGPSVDLAAAVALADTLRITRPTLGVILVRRRVDTAVLAEALRAGMREVVEERDLSGVNDAVARSYALFSALTRGSDIDTARPAQGQLITIFSAKGGVGKTTIATNLAAALADGGKRNVCVVDLDLAFGDVSIVLQLFPVHTMADAAHDGRKLDPSAVESLLTDHSPGLKVLAAPVQPDAKESISGDLVGDVLRILKEQFEIVICDCPPAFDDVVLQAFDESDLLLLIGTLDIPALKSLKITAETLSLLNHPRETWRLILNRADVKVGLSKTEVEKTLKLPVFASLPQSDDVPASVNRGTPIVLDSPRHAVSQAVKRLAHDALASTNHGETEPNAKQRHRRLRRKAST